MGQSSSQVMESRAILVQNWQPQDNQPSVLVNRITHEHVQKHTIRILVKDLPRQTALFASRMSNHQSFICRLMYFHPAVPDPRASQETEKDFREMYIYTDRMMPLRDWNQQKVKMVIQGFKRLVSVNGPIKITENMICENQNGEIKVWMSQNPVNNHPDSKYMSEEQTVADVATVLTKKNKDLAGKLMGCHTLRDILEKFSCTVRQNSSPFQNYSHRASQSGDFHSKKFEYIDRGQPNIAYRNVFGQAPDKKLKEQGFLTPKPSPKMYENYPQSAFGRVQEQCKPKSNMGYVEKLRQNAKNIQKTEEKSGTVSALSRKVAVESSLQAKGNLLSEEEPKNTAKISKNDEAKLEQKKRSYKLAQAASYTNLQPQYNFHRFETTKFGSTNNLFMPSFTSAKNIKNEQWRQYQSKNIGSQGDIKQTNFCNSSAANFPAEEVKRGYDITIINNNVNNFINNVTHNHVVKFQRKMPEQSQFRSPTTQQSMSQMNQKTQYSSKKQPSNPNVKQKHQFVPVPHFLQHRKRNNLDEAASPANSKAQPHLYPKRQFKPFSQQQEETIPANKNGQQSETFYLAQRSTEKHSTMSKQMSLNSNYSSISNSQQTPTTPKTPMPGTGYGQNFSSFMKANNSSFELKSGLRTKTTEFFAKVKDVNKIDGSIQNKSFTQNEKISLQFEHLQEHRFVQKVHSAKIFEEIIEPKPRLELLSQKSIPKEEPVPQEKQNFKKQLRNEFKFLLGGDPPKEEPKLQEVQLSKQNSDVAPQNEGKQVQVKDKIIKKQMQFAQLKKQALKVLIDI